jgi:hypothetical protein
MAVLHLIMMLICQVNPLVLCSTILSTRNREDDEFGFVAQFPNSNSFDLSTSMQVSVRSSKWTLTLESSALDCKKNNLPADYMAIADTITIRTCILVQSPNKHIDQKNEYLVNSISA